MEKELNAPVLCAAWAKNGHIICGGGGGNRHIGAANFLVVLNFDADSLRLSDPLYTFDTDDEVPNILAVHPNGTDFMCSFIANRRHDGKLEILRLFCDEEEGKRIEIAADREQLQALKHVNEQSALKFSRDGSFLAMGGKNGHLQVFEWPLLKPVLDEPHKADKRISDLDFSTDNSCLAVTVDGRACELWDLTKRSQISTIPLPGATFGRFSLADTNLLHLVAQGQIITWNTVTSKRVRGARTWGGNSAIAEMQNGCLAVGRPSGAVTLLTEDLQGFWQYRPHKKLVSSVQFSSDDRFLLSASKDHTVRITPNDRGMVPDLLAAIFAIAAVAGIGALCVYLHQ